MPRRRRTGTGRPLAGRPLGGAETGRSHATVHGLLAAFPAAASFADAELAAVAAADELAQGSLLAAEQYLDVAERLEVPPPPSRRCQAQVLLGVVRLLLYGAQRRPVGASRAGAAAASGGRGPGGGTAHGGGI